MLKYENLNCCFSDNPQQLIFHILISSPTLSIHLERENRSFDYALVNHAYRDYIEAKPEDTIKLGRKGMALVFDA
jgi:hypothetical protein